MSKPRTRKVRLKYPAGDFKDHDVDPRDSDSLRRLRSIIDDEIGWNSPDDEEGGDYEARLREVANELRHYRMIVASARVRARSIVERLEDFDRAARAAVERGVKRG